MYVSEDYRVGFIAHPRMASRVLGQTIEQNGGQLIGEHHTIDDGVCRDIYANGGNVACIKRNMYDVLPSWYHHTWHKHEFTFPKWLKECVLEPREEGLWPRWFAYPIYHYGLPLCTYQIPFERLHTGVWDDFLRDNGQDPIGPLDHFIGMTIGRLPYNCYYGRETVSLVAERFETDLQLTGYHF
jgi:hypothetical protein